MDIQFQIIETANRDIYDRLFVEALPLISAERLRLGEENLREGMWDGLTDPSNKIYQVTVDGHVTMYICYKDYTYNEEAYRLLMHPTVGCDANGSKAWYYSEEFKQAEQAFDAAQNHAGIITLFNPNTPAALSMETNFGSYSTIEVFQVNDFDGGVFNFLDLPDTMRVMVVTWN